MNDTTNKLTEMRTEPLDDDFFIQVYDDARKMEEELSISFLKEHPRVLLSKLRNFIFHDKAFHNLSDEMQNVLQACMFCVK